MTAVGPETAVYVRVSTTKESQKDSPEHQLGLCREKARALGLDVRYVYEDRDSGTSIVGRKQIQTLIRDAGNGCFRNILFASLSRFSRDTLDSLNLKRVLVDALGLRLISIEEGYDSAKDHDELKFQILSAVNQKLSEQISLSSRRGIRQSALKGNFTGSVPPYGYRKAKIGGRKTLVPDEAARDTVQLIFRLYTVERQGEKAIAAYLNDRGIPSPKGGKWGVSSVQNILKNEVYTGENVFGKYEVIRVYNDVRNLADRSRKQIRRGRESWERSGFLTHEPLIGKDTFRLAQEIRQKRGGGRRGGPRRKANAFSGIIFCAHCGSAMVSVKSQASGKEKEYRYLACSARRRKGAGACGNCLRIPYEPFRDAVLSELGARIRRIMEGGNLAQKHIANIVPDRIEPDSAKTGQLEKRIEAARTLLHHLRKQRWLGEIEEEQFEFERALCEKEIGRLKLQLERIPGNAEIEADPAEARARAERLLGNLAELRFDSLDELQLVLKRLVDRISVFADGTVEIVSALEQANTGPASASPQNAAAERP